MSELKISQLQVASTSLGSDTLMIIQNSINKQITLETFFNNVTTPFQYNPAKTAMSFDINGSNQSHLLYVNGSTNRVGIKTDSPDSALQVVGDIRVGGQLSTEKVIITITAGAAVGSYKTVTVTTSTSHGFATNDKIYINGVTTPATGMGGLQSITVTGAATFTYLILATVTTDTIITSTPKAVKTSFFPGVIKESLEEVLLTSSVIYPITASYETTALNTQVSSANCSLTSYASTGQTKTIYLKSVRGSGTVTFNSVNGKGFNKIQLLKEGDTVSLKFDGTHWFVIGTYGALVTNV